MTKFGDTAEGGHIGDGRELPEEREVTTNLAGGTAFTSPAMEQLYRRCAATLFGEPKYYDASASGDWEEIPRLVTTVWATHPEFVLQLALYCRSELHLRSISHVLLVEAFSQGRFGGRAGSRHSDVARAEKLNRAVNAYVPAVIQRADDLTEVLSYWVRKHGSIGSGGPRGLPNGLRRGLARAFVKFDAYSFGKYAGHGLQLKMRDAIRICHPDPVTADRSTLFRQVAAEAVPVPETWETFSRTHKMDKTGWTKILPQMPFLARLRNLRNFLQREVDISPVVELLENREAVTRSRVFPYQLYTAYRAIRGIESVDTPRLLEALSSAMTLSAESLPNLGGSTLILCDNSGSMSQNHLSAHSEVTCKIAATTMGAISLFASDRATVGVFADRFALVPLMRSTPIPLNIEQIAETDVGGSTYAYLAFQWLLRSGQKFDRILLFSDEQCYGRDSYDGYEAGDQSLQRLLTAYRGTVHPSAYLYSFDLRGYGTTQFLPDGRTILLAGFSERVLSFLGEFEKDRRTAIDRIRSLTPDSYRRRASE